MDALRCVCLMRGGVLADVFVGAGGSEDLGAGAAAAGPGGLAAREGGGGASPA